MDPDILRAITRRHFFKQSGFGIGGVALSALLDDRLFAQAAALTGRRSARAARAAFRAEGEAGHLPVHGRRADASSTCSTTSRRCRSSTARTDARGVRSKGERFAFIQRRRRAARAAVQVRRSTGSAAPRLSELLAAPGGHRRRHLRSSARSTPTQFNHAPGQIFLNTGSPHVRPAEHGVLGRRTASAARADDLPGFVVLLQRRAARAAAKSCWWRGFLPTHYQGVDVPLQGRPGPVRVATRTGVDAAHAARRLDLVHEPEPAAPRRGRGDPEIATRIAQYEMAYRMQTQRAGADGPLRASRADRSRCTARSPARRRSPTTACSRGGWSSAACGSCSSITAAGTTTATSAPARHEVPKRASRPTARRRRWSRTSSSAACSTTRWSSGAASSAARRWSRATRRSRLIGRDHHPRPSPSGWPAAASSRASRSGATDDLGYNVVEDPVHVHDLHATILHLLGLDHTKLTYKFQGRDFRLTDVRGEVMTKLIA